MQHSATSRRTRPTRTGKIAKYALVLVILSAIPSAAFARPAIAWRFNPGYGNGCQPDVYSGNVMNSFSDSIPTGGLPLVNSIHLNSQYVEKASDGRLLGNATFTYDIHVKSQPNGDTTPHQTVVDGTGRIWDLIEPGFFSSLTANGSGWTLSNAGPPESIGQAGDFTYTFDSLGRLTQIVDPMGNVQTVAYSNGSITITDVGTGKQIAYAPVSGGISITEAGVHTETVFLTGGLVTSIIWYGSTQTQLTRVDFTYDSATATINTYGISVLKTFQKDLDPNTTITYAPTAITPTNGTKKIPFLNQSGPGGKLATFYQWGLTPLLGAPAVTRVSNHNNKIPYGVTDYEFDSQGNLVRVLSPTPYGATARPIAEIAWDPNNHPSSVTLKDTDPNHPSIRTYQLSYSPAGKLTTLQDPLAHSWFLNREPNGVDLYSAADPVGLLLALNYDYTGTVSYPNNPGGYNLPHFPTRMTDSGGNTTTITGTSSGQVSVVTPPSPGAGGYSVNYYGYPITGLLQDFIFGGQQTHFGNYDSRSDVTSLTKYPYSPNGGAQTETFGALYDTLGRQLQLAQPDGQTFFNWFFNGRNLDYTVDEAGTRSNYTFCPICGALEGVSVGSRASPIWSLNWIDDNDGDFTDFVNPLGKHTISTYGAATELKSVTYPGGGGTLNFAYDNFGRVNTFQNARGNTFTFLTDIADRVKNVYQTGVVNPILTLDYNDDNSLKTATNAMGTVNIVTDPRTRKPQSVTYNYAAGGLPDLQKVEYLYYPDGTRQAMTWWNGGVKVGTWVYHYNGAGRTVQVTSVFSDTSEVSAWLYEADGKLDWQNNQNGTWNGLFYGGSGTTVNYRDWPTIVGNWSPVNGKYFQVDRLTYDGQAAGGGTVGNLTGLKYLDNHVSQYHYNSLNRLDSDSANGVYPYSQAFTVNSAGNRYVSNGAGFTFNDSDILTAVNGSSTGVGYDADGNVTSLPSRGGLSAHSLTWNSLSQPTTIDGASYGYDALGHRVKQVSGGATTFYIYDGDLLLGEVQPGGASAGGGAAGPTIGRGTSPAVIGDDIEFDYSIPPDPVPAMPGPPNISLPPPDPDPGFSTPPDSGQQAGAATGTSSSTVHVVYTWARRVLSPNGSIRARLAPTVCGTTMGRREKRGTSPTSTACRPLPSSTLLPAFLSDLRPPPQ